MQGLRTYRVSRIEDARVLDEAVERPADFDLAEYWTASSQRFARERRRYAATLRIEPTSARWLLAYQNATVVADADPGDRVDWVTLVAHFDAEDEAAFVVVRPRVAGGRHRAGRAARRGSEREAQAIVERTSTWTRQHDGPTWPNPTRLPNPINPVRRVLSAGRGSFAG